jgi:hypothetical protein
MFEEPSEKDQVGDSIEILYEFEHVKEKKQEKPMISPKMLTCVRKPNIWVPACLNLNNKSGKNSLFTLSHCSGVEVLRYFLAGSELVQSSPLLVHLQKWHCHHLGSCFHWIWSLMKGECPP